MYEPLSYKTDGIRSIKSETFGEHLTCDHVIVYRDNEASIEGCRLALILKDVGTSFMHAHRSGRESQDECYHALTHFVSNKDEVGTIYSDSAPEITGAIKDLGWRHEQSKAYIHQPNVLAEGAIRATAKERDPTLNTQDYLTATGHMRSNMHAYVTTQATLVVWSTLHGTSVLALVFLDL